MNKVFILFFVVLILQGCAAKKSEDSKKFLFVSTGLCSSGPGITTYTAQNSSRVLSKVNLETRELTTIFDLTAPFAGGLFSPETGIQSVIDNDRSLFILTENATNTAERRIYSVPKSSPYNTSLYSVDATAFGTTITRSMALDSSDGTILFSKSSSIEKLGTNALRIPIGIGPWVNNPGTNGTNICTGSNALITDLAVMPKYGNQTSGKIIYAHQGTTAAANKLGIISNNGYSATADCLAGVQISSVAHTNASYLTGPTAISATNGVSPTSMIYIPNTGSSGGKLIVGYSTSITTGLNNTGASLNFAIVMWTVGETSTTVASLTSPIILYNDWTKIFGISAMAYDPETSSLYVATASQPGIQNQTTSSYGYKIEKFHLDLQAPSITIDAQSPFVQRSSVTKCISGLSIGTEN